MESLFHITQELRHITDEIAANEGELTEKHEEILERLSQELTLKTDNVAEYVQSQETYINDIQERINQFKELQDQVKKNLAKFNEYLLTCMDQADTTEIKGKFFKVQIPKPRAVVEITNEDEIPLEYIKTKTVTTIDKAQIKKDLSEKEIAGAKLTTGKRSVKFKTNKG